MVGCFSGLTVSHMASLIVEKHQSINSNQPTVYVCVSNCTDAQREELQHTISSMGCNSKHGSVVSVLETTRKRKKQKQRGILCLCLFDDVISCLFVSLIFIKRQWEEEALPHWFTIYKVKWQIFLNEKMLVVDSKFLGTLVLYQHAVNQVCPLRSSLHMNIIICWKWLPPHQVFRKAITRKGPRWDLYNCKKYPKARICGATKVSRTLSVEWKHRESVTDHTAYLVTVCVCCVDVKLIQEVFQSLDGGDKRLQKVRVILLIPRCSMSAVSNPVDFMLQENGGSKLCTAEKPKTALIKPICYILLCTQNAYCLWALNI